MKRFLTKIGIFFFLMVIIDIACGCFFDFLKSNARSGRTFKNEYLFKLCEDDILVLGSSRADHSYVPEVFRDSLGITCFNAGEMGCGIIPAYVRYKMVVNRHKPRIVLYEVTPEFDYYQDNLYSRYLGTIRQYTENDFVRDVYIDFSDKMEPLRLLSNMYRNNSSIITNLKDVIMPTFNMNGYEPLYGELSSIQSVECRTNYFKAVDSLKLSYMERLIEDTKVNKIPLVFLISPYYYNSNVDMNTYVVAEELCKKYAIPFINNSNLEKISGDASLFQDNEHLNHKGALKYSSFVSMQISGFLK